MWRNVMHTMRSIIQTGINGMEWQEVLPYGFLHLIQTWWNVAEVWNQAKMEVERDWLEACVTQSRWTWLEHNDFSYCWSPVSLVFTPSSYGSNVLYGIWARYMHRIRPFMSRQYCFTCVLNTFHTVWAWFLPVRNALIMFLVVRARYVPCYY